MTKTRISALLCLCGLCLCGTSRAADWKDLLNGKNLDGWQVIGTGVWSVLKDGTLVGQADPQTPFQQQSWLYTKAEFQEFDLRLEYWMRLGSNSGVSIGDKSRARYAVSGPESDGHRTPARIAYEINIDNGQPVDYDITGSIYLIAKAEVGVQNRTDWNTLEIQARKNLIRVLVNGKVVAEHPGLPERPKAGPIGLQLHDSRDVVMFRNIQIKEAQ
jgi:hypothetical protein